MASAFETFRRFGPAAFVLKAIVAAAAADILLLGFILLRRTYRKWYFARRDARVLEIRKCWDALLSGEIPYQNWRTKSFDRRIIQTIILDRFEVAGPEESARLLRFLRASGLVEKQIFEARHHQGWRRHRALLSLGRTRAPEGIPALSEGLRDRALETRLAALRGLERLACPEAGQEILKWVSEGALRVPALPLQSALIQCCAEQPSMLLPYLQHAEPGTREVLGRVLGEIATPLLAKDLLHFVEDELPELRAAAARGLGRGQANLAIDILGQLAKDPVWFVRLRAVVSLGELCDARTISPLLESLGDSHRLVRLRSAEALVRFREKIAAIFERVVESHDRYGLHAYLAALDNADCRSFLESELSTTPTLGEGHRETLLGVLRSGSLPSEHFATNGKAQSAGA